MPDTRGQRRENESGIDIPQMIRHHEHRTLEALQVLPPQNARPSQQHDRWPHEELVREQTYPRDRPAQHPSRIVIRLARSGFPAQHPLDIADSLH